MPSLSLSLFVGCYIYIYPTLQMLRPSNSIFSSFSKQRKQPHKLLLSILTGSVKKPWLPSTMLDQSAYPQGLTQQLLELKRSSAGFNHGSTSSASTSHSICRGLSGLEELYDCVDDLLQMASTQQLLYQQEQEKCMDELLDGSVKLLDICGITRDFMLQVKEHVFALQSALRRRKGDSCIETSIAKYSCFSKKMKKDGKKLITQLKQADNKIGASQLLEQDQHLAAVIRVLRQVGARNMSIFQSLLVFLAVPVSKAKSNRWSLVSKLMHKGVIACEAQEDINGHELDGVDSALSSLSKSAEVEKIQIAHKKLEALEACIEGLESGLESVFRRLIKTRASLLNIISQ